MRCLSCNKILNTQESTRKYSSSGSYVDLCNRCYSYVADDIAAIEGEGYVEDFEDEGTGEEFSEEGWDGLLGTEDDDDDANQDN